MELSKFVQIEPVGQCNLKCRMCPIQFRKDGALGGPAAFMCYEVFCQLVDQFPCMEELHLQGLGEPMLHPRYFDMVRYASARGVQVSTNTNLIVCTETRVRDCLGSGLRKLYVSLRRRDGRSVRADSAWRELRENDAQSAQTNDVMAQLSI